TTTPLVAAVNAAISPSAVTRPPFLAAFDKPFLRSQSWAAVMSPADSVSAALQSIMPAPVDSRRSFTIAAVLVLLGCVLCLSVAAAAWLIRHAALTQQTLRLEAMAERERPSHELFRFRGQCLGLGDPGVGAARKSDLFADLVRGVVIELGELPVMEDAE